MSLTLKAFLYDKTWRGDPVEIRRFTIDQDVSSSYAYLVEKVVQVFPSLRPGNVTLAWTDSDGDLITISSDEELVEALDRFEGDIFRLYLKRRSGAPCCDSKPVPTNGDENSPREEVEGGEKTATPNDSSQAQPDQTPFHPGVMCDGCNGPIYGTRFKCLMCQDYDLCSSCEGKGIHVDHNMITITQPYTGGFGFPRGFGPFGGRCGRPFRGGQRCHGGRGRWPGGHSHHHSHPHGFQGQPPFSWFPGFGMGGGAGCFGGGGSGGTQCKPDEKNPHKSATEEPMDTEQKSEVSEEERRVFLQGIGEAVSSFLQPFGVKVDLDVAGGGESEKPESDATPSAPVSTDQSELSSEAVDEALVQLGTMGYHDEGGWLKELVKAKGGDVAKVLDALHPNVEQD